MLIGAFQGEEVDDEDISDTENTAVPTCKLSPRLHFFLNINITPL